MDADLQELVAAADIRGDQYAFQLVREVLVPLAEALDRLSDYTHHLEDCAECKFVPCDEVGDLGQSLVDAGKALALVKKYAGE